VPGVPAWEKMMEALALMATIGTNASLPVGGIRMNGAEPQSVHEPGLVALTPGSSRELSLSSSCKATLDDAPSVPRSLDIVDLGNGELGLPGYPRAPPLSTSWGQVVGVWS
jgi:hypothetical protein